MIILLAIGSGDCMIKAVYSHSLWLKGGGELLRATGGDLQLQGVCLGSWPLTVVYTYICLSAIPTASKGLSPWASGDQAHLPANLPVP